MDRHAIRRMREAPAKRMVRGPPPKKTWPPEQRRAKLAAWLFFGERVLAGLTTHVLDVTRGGPAIGVRIELYEFGADGGRTLVTAATTNADGRTDAPLIAAGQARVGRFELVFHAGRLFPQPGRETRRPSFSGRRSDPLRRRRPRLRITTSR